MNESESINRVRELEFDKSRERIRLIEFDAIYRKTQKRIEIPCWLTFYNNKTFRIISSIIIWKKKSEPQKKFVRVRVGLNSFPKSLKNDISMQRSFVKHLFEK